MGMSKMRCEYQWGCVRMAGDNGTGLCTPHFDQLKTQAEEPVIPEPEEYEYPQFYSDEEARQ